MKRRGKEDRESWADMLGGKRELFRGGEMRPFMPASVRGNRRSSIFWGGEWEELCAFPDCCIPFLLLFLL